MISYIPIYTIDVSLNPNLFLFKGVKRAQKFEELLKTDARFLIPATRHLGLVVFCLQKGNHLTEILLKRLNTRGNIHCVPAALKGTTCSVSYCITFPILWLT